MKKLKIEVDFNDYSDDPIAAIKLLLSKDRRQTTVAKFQLFVGEDQVGHISVVAHFTAGYEKLLQYLRDSLRWKNEDSVPVPNLPMPSRGLRQWST